jgi:hypothetical protein
VFNFNRRWKGEDTLVNLRTTALATALLVLCAIAVFAADFNGKWVGQVVMGQGRPTEQTFLFKVKDGKVAGTVTTPMGEMQISEGKVSGDEISFVTTMEVRGNQMKMAYKGKISGNEIKFVHGREGGQSHPFTAQRATP